MTKKKLTSGNTENILFRVLLSANTVRAFVLGLKKPKIEVGSLLKYAGRSESHLVASLKIQFLEP